MNARTVEWFQRVVAEYTGRVPGVPFEVVPDPGFDDAYAIRSGEEFYLLVGYRKGANVGAMSHLLEEVEFTTWPPTSGEPKFL